MNLATLVSSFVLAASTATAGLLVAPTSLPAAPQHGDDESGFQIGPFCIDCGDGNETSGNGTAPPPSDNETAPPPHHNHTAPPPSHNETAPPARTCGVHIDDGQTMVGATQQEWAWQVGTGTRNLTVTVQADGAWMPLGGGVRIVLTDGDGEVVASSATSGASLPFDYTGISYHADSSAELSRGLWHLSVEADGVLGSTWVEVHSEC